MSQGEMLGPVDRSVGYVLKQASDALRSALDEALRPLQLTVTQYSTLELLRQLPDQSNADLARGAFVTRQSMNDVLRGLVDRGLVSRADAPTQGRALPAQLTAAGATLIFAASRAAADVERMMTALLDGARRDRLMDDLHACIDGLGG